jgi:two-component system phosphate regulon sensor histidine kinase PhoR
MRRGLLDTSAWRRFGLSSPSSEDPRSGQASSWPIVTTGLAALLALLALILLQRVDPWAALAAGLAVIAVTGSCVVASDRSGEVRRLELGLGAAARVGAPTPLAGLVHALPDPILVVTATEPDDLTSRRYIFANRAATAMLRLERGEGLLVNAIRDPEVLDAVDAALFAGRPAECLYETAGVQPLTLRTYARPLEPGEDGRRMALVLFRDETETRQVERTRADFLANASHELRTPLASLSGFIETLRGHAKDDDPAVRDRFLGIMQAQAARMSRLIDDLMSLSRIELAEHIQPADLVDLAACVSDVLDGSAPIAARRGVTLKGRLPRRGSARIVGDRDQILQVIQNLVDNAIKYSPEGRAVEVLLQAGLSIEAASAPYRPGAQRLSLLNPDVTAPAYAALRVSDRGPGIPREHLPRLTERFYRVEGQKSGDRSGSGLGLAIVKHIVNRHRGGLTVESAPGEGATFTVYLPMASARGGAPAAPVGVSKQS